MNILSQRKICLLLAIIQTVSFGQIKLSGTILNKATQQPIEYANIGLFEKEVGTICNVFGEFELIIPENLKSNPLIISHLGYKNAVINVGKTGNLSGLKIELEPASIELKEVKITSTQEIILGYKPGGKEVKGFFKAAGLGLEGGTMIQNNGPAELDNFNFNILKIPFDSLKFRLNFYSVKKGKPSQKVNRQDLLFTVSKADTGLFSLPLENEKILLTGNFICTIELVELFGQKAENAEFLFSAIPNESGFICKKSISMGKWDTIKNYSLCFWLIGKK